MRMEQVSANCFAVLNEQNLVCDANSGLINVGDGVVIDTQSDLPHGRQMIKLFDKVWRDHRRRKDLLHRALIAKLSPGALMPSPAPSMTAPPM